MDENGWVYVEQLLKALKENNKWENITEEDFRYIINNSDKKRHELLDGKIRAIYGHSIPQKILKEISEPPEFLFHGTARRYIDSIMNVGLMPCERQYVHLSKDIETALQVGKRHDKKPVVLKIESKKAWQDSVKFYLGNDKVWLADIVPSEYIVIPY